MSLRRYRRLAIVTGVVLALTTALVIRNQVVVWRARQARDASARQFVEAQSMSLPRTLFEALQPVALSNCTLERFGEAHDGGYLLCANLLDRVAAAYSYGISGYDGWGCDVSTRLGVSTHQYDCFDTRAPACPTGKTVFHAECIGPSRANTEGRVFDSLENQLAANGDRGRHIVLKMDVEGAEWDSLLATSDEQLQRIDQLAIEFHWLREPDDGWRMDDRYLALVQLLKRHFHVANIHFNNYSCTTGLEPFPAWAYEVLFVSKRLGVEDPTGKPAGPRAPDAPNNPAAPECAAPPHP